MTTVKNSPVGDSEQDLEKQDSFLKRLSNIAYASKDNIKKEKNQASSKYTSRFFFHVDDKNELNVIEDASQAKPAEEPINLEIIKRADKYSKELPNDLRESILLVREFFLKEIAPKSIALQGGLAQAKAVIEQQIGEVDSSDMAWAEKFAAHSSKLRVLRFIKELFELNDDEAEKLFELALIQKQPQVVVVPQTVHQSSNISSSK